MKYEKQQNNINYAIDVSVLVILIKHVPGYKHVV